MTVPILIIAYNRPNIFFRQIQALKKNRPKNLYVFCDGPKNSLDLKKVTEVHNTLSLIDWDCNVQTLFLKKNKGCQLGVATALDWFFSNVSEGIVLEDDCIPHKDFFTFVSTMLEKYRQDDRVCQITGYNAGFKSRSPESYFFSSYSSSWGWATWRDRWQRYSYFKKNGVKILQNKVVRKYVQSKHIPHGYTQNTLKALNGKLDSWAYIWGMSNIVNHQLTIIPNKNLIKNIGFGEGSTHTKFKTSSAFLEIEALDGDFIHPKYVVPNVYFDNFESKQHSRVYVVLDVIKQLFRIVR